MKDYALLTMTQKQSTRQSRSASRLMNRLDFGDPWENLASAIICYAVDDYREALRTNNRLLKESVERFFLSTWYQALTKYNGYDLMYRLQQEYEDSVCNSGVVND